MENEEIAYQNKDITSKVLAENFKGKTFRVYGLELPGLSFFRYLTGKRKKRKEGYMTWLTLQ